MLITNPFPFITVSSIYLWVLMISEVVAETCITCKRDTLEDCTVGKTAAEYEDQRQECSASLPFCEVVVQEWLGSEEPGAGPQLRDVSRGCLQEERFTCTTAGDVRTCTATCQGYLCNDFEDVAERVREFERLQEEAARRMRQWLIPVVVSIAGLTLLAIVLLLIFRARARANRRKALGLG